MKGVAARPRRSARSEILSLLCVIAAPAAVVAVLPRGAIGFVPSPLPPPVRARCAWVDLSEGQIAAAMEGAHAAWRVRTSAGGRLRADLISGVMPEERVGDTIDISERTRPAPPPPAVYAPAPLPPTMAAGAPEKIAPAPSDPDGEAAFPRDELLKTGKE